MLFEKTNQPLLGDSADAESQSTFDKENVFAPMPDFLTFTSKQSNTEVSEWLCLDQLTSPERVLNCFQTSNTVELQERLNAMTARRDLWFPEFLDFLGIDDERVRLICANDH